MRIVVTGHRGYVGSVLCPVLLRLGHSVIGFDTDFYRGCSFGGEPEPVESRCLDIRDVTPADLAGADAVIHLAGLSNDPLGDLDPDLTYDINHHGTVRLARAAKAAGVSRFVFSSSCSSYGIGGTELLTENSPLRPVTPYAISKIRSEDALDGLADSGFSPVSLRSGTAYGMSPRIRFDLVVNNLTAWAMATGHVRLKSDGTAWRPLVHVADMAEAFVCAVAADRSLVHQERFNVGRTEDSLQVRTVAEMVREAVPGATITFAADAEADRRTYRVDCSKIARIGFRSDRLVGEGIAELVEAYGAHGVSVSDFEGDRFQRLARVKRLVADGELSDTLRWRQRASA